MAFHSGLVLNELMNPKIDGYLRKAKKWEEEMQKLRSSILDVCGKFFKRKGLND